MTALSDPQAEKPPAESLPDEPTAATNPPMESTTWDRLVRTHQAGVWRYLRYLGAANAEADDLTQETFLSVARGKFRELSPQQTASYLRTAARNQLLMLRRRQSRRVSTVALEAAEAEWTAAGADRHWEDLLDSLDECVQQLAGRQREVVDLQYRQGASRQTIAKQLGMKADGVKTLLRRTRQLLRECIERRRDSVLD